MENYEKLYKQMKRLNILLVVMVVFCLAVIVFLLLVPGGSEKAPLPVETTPVAETPTEPTSQPVPTEEPEVEPTAQPETEPASEPETKPQEMEGMLAIETPYLDLKFPMEWKSNLQYKQTSTADLHTVAFKCAVAGQEVPLFDVLLGNTDMGEQMGYLQTEDKLVPVCILFYEFVPDDTWREEDTYILYAMQEAANDLVTCLTAEDNYIPQ